MQALQQFEQQTAEVLRRQRDRITAAARVGQRLPHQPVGVWVGHADLTQRTGDAQTGVEIVDEGLKPRKTTFNPDVAPGTVKPRRDRRCVEAQHRRHAHGIGGAMVGAVDGTDGVRQRVDGAQPLLEGDGAH